MIGSKILHYQVLEKLGEGGMGEVYLAEDTRLHRRVALKFLHQSIREDEAARERLIREARSASQLNHPNIVATHAIEEADDHVFIVMEYVDGQSLKDLIRSGSLTEADAFKLARQILDALGAAHELDIVHRDIKSDNILITPKGESRVLDFGLARSRGVSSVTQFGSSAGTPAYMSPEQIQSEDVDQRADLFSFGVVLFEMFTGHVPFKGEHEAALTYSIVNEPPEPLATHNPSAPADLQRIVERALAKSPEDRYQSAAEFSRDLSTLSAGGEPVGAKRGRVRPGLSIAAVVVVIAAMAMLVVNWNGEIPAPAEAGRAMMAVLPFENLGPTDQEYFADGMTEEITTHLAKLSGLGVISRTSALVYKGSDKSMREIGNELDVEYVLEGTIRWDKSGGNDRVRISTQLIRCADDTHLWAETYDRVFEQIFELQSEIAQNVATALDVTLLEPERKALETPPTENLLAYDYYLQGRKYFDEGNDLEKRDIAVEMFEKAAAADSTFALAHAMLARLYSNDHFNSLHPDQPRMEQAKKAADMAIRHSDSGVEGNIAMGYYHYYGSRDYDRALDEFYQATDQQPNNSDLHAAMGYVLRRKGRWKDALASLEKSVGLDPRSMQKTSTLIQTAILMREYDVAETYLERAMALTPDNPSLYAMRAWRNLLNANLEACRADLTAADDLVPTPVFVQFKMVVEIVARDYEKAMKENLHYSTHASIDTASYFSNMGVCYLLSDRTEEARAHFDSARVVLEGRYQKTPEDEEVLGQLALVMAGLEQPVRAFEFAQRARDIMPLSHDAVAGANVLESAVYVYAIIGNAEAAIDQLELLLSIPSQMTVPYMRASPFFDSLREHPRFKRLVGEIPTTHQP